MKVLIASDHGGFQLKKHIIKELTPMIDNLEFVDLGPTDEKSVDYPDYSKKLCEALIKKQGDVGILVCGSGQGMAIQANRHKGIRAALCWDIPSAKLSRQHNDANILCLGGRLIPFGNALEIAKVWLQTPYEGGRHQNRINKFDF